MGDAAQWGEGRGGGDCLHLLGHIHLFQVTVHCNWGAYNSGPRYPDIVFALGTSFCIMLDKRMLAQWPIFQGSSFCVVLDKHTLAQWPLFLEIVVSHCTVQVHAGPVAKVSCDSLLGNHSLDCRW